MQGRERPETVHTTVVIRKERRELMQQDRKSKIWGTGAKKQSCCGGVYCGLHHFSTSMVVE
jgi:hypothetical protein